MMQHFLLLNKIKHVGDMRWSIYFIITMNPGKPVSDLLQEVLHFNIESFTYYQSALFGNCCLLNLHLSAFYSFPFVLSKYIQLGNVLQQKITAHYEIIISLRKHRSNQLVNTSICY